MKKGVMGGAAAVLLVGGAVAACWFTGQAFDKQVPAELAKAQQLSGIQLEWTPGKTSFLSREGAIKMVLTPEFISSHYPELTPEHPFELYLSTQTRILPLYSATQVVLDKSRGDLAAGLVELGLQGWEPVLESRNSLWSRRNVSTLTLPEANVAKQGENLKMLPLVLGYDGDLNGSGKLNLDWQGMTFSQPDQQTEINLAHVTGQAELDEIGGVLMVPASEGDVAGLSVRIGDELNVALQGLSTRSHVEGDDAETLASRYETRLQSLKLAMDGEAVALTEGEMVVDIKGMDLEGYRMLQQANSGVDMDPQKLEQALNLLLARGATLSLSNFSAKVNAEPVSLKGNLVLSSTTLDKLTNGVDGLRALTGQFDAILSGKLGNALPQAAPLLQGLTAMGYLKAEGNQLKADINLANGRLTVNSLPL